MASNEANLFCESCGQAFTTFLQEMAEHNAKVVCPRCGQSQDLADATTLSKNLGCTEETTR